MPNSFTNHLHTPLSKRSLSIIELFNDHVEPLKLTWVSAVGVERFVEIKDREVFGPDVVGHMNLIYSHRVQVLGNVERAWYDRVGPERFLRQIEELIAADPRPPALIVADDLPVLEDARALCEKTGTPLFATPKACAEVIDSLHLYLSKRFADTQIIHGVFLEVFGLGVLITGDSGIGKSELALDLITRGHCLVADDAVEFARTTPKTIEGRCPPVLQDYLEVRGLGLLNIRSMFGETAARRKMRLKLIVDLQRADFKHPKNAARLPLDVPDQDVLGVPIRKTIFHVEPGRNLAVLIEVAVRHTILKMRGVDTTQDFMARQQQVILQQA